MEKTLKKFVFCSPVTPIYEMHSHRPYFEFPKAASHFGFGPYLIIGKNHFKYNGPVNVIETGDDSNRHLNVVRTFPFLLKFITREKPSVFVFFHMNLVLPFIVSATKIFGLGKKVKFLLKMDWDGSAFSQLGKFMPLRNLFLAFESFFVDRIIIENKCGYDSLSSIPLINKKKIILLPNGYPEDFIQQAGYSNFKRHPIILTVSRISPEKGLDILIIAFAALSFEFPKWKLHIVGPIEDVVYYNKCVSLVEYFNIQSRIVFTGPLYSDSLKSEYYHSSIFCLPSFEESFAIVRLEAIAAGLPLVTSEAGCGREYRHFGSMIFKIGDIAELKEHLKKLMANERLREEISAKQQGSIISYDIIIEKLLRSLALLD